jgi:hypothetical protein
VPAPFRYRSMMGCQPKSWRSRSISAAASRAEMAKLHFDPALRVRIGLQVSVFGEQVSSLTRFHIGDIFQYARQFRLWRGAFKCERRRFLHPF